MNAHPGYKGTLPQDVRDQRIVDAYLQGASLADIGREHGITRERVRQILAKHETSTRTRADTVQMKYEAWVSTHGPDLDASFDASRSIAAVIEAYPDFSKVWIRRYLNDRSWEQTPARRTNWSHRFSDDDLLAILRRCAVDGRVTICTYNSAKRSTDPSTKTIIDRFGSWSEAARAAGLAPGRTYREYTRKWSNDELRAALRQYAEAAVARCERPTIRGYEEYRFLQAPELPSVSIIRSRLGGSIMAIVHNSN
jgi:transposase-like protein